MTVASRVIPTPLLPSACAGHRFPIRGSRLRRHRHRHRQNCLPGAPDVRPVAQRELAWAPALELVVVRAAEPEQVLEWVRVHWAPFRRESEAAAVPA